MKKMKTLFEKDPNNLGRVIDGKIREENMWVFDEGVKATRKFDGTSCMIKDNVLYKRLDAKKGRKIPEGAIPCIPEPDEYTGHFPHWIPVDFNDKANKYHKEGSENTESECFEIIERLNVFTGHTSTYYYVDGTYELCGPKIQGNPENLDKHKLIKHGSVEYDIKKVLENPREFMRDLDIEGIAFIHPDGRMCKIRKKDFGDKRK